MGVPVSYMVSQVRLRSGLRSNTLFTDDEIATLLTAAYFDIRDKLIVRFVGWFCERHPFTLAGGVGANILDLADVPRLEMVQGVDFLDASGNRYTVEMLESFANRNDGQGAWPAGAGPGWGGSAWRRYWVDGDELQILPPAVAQGTYELIYSPMGLSLKLPVEISPMPYSRSIAHSAVTGPHGVDGTTNIGRVVLNNGAFTSRDDDGTLVLASTGVGDDGTYTLTDVFDDTQIEVTPNPGGPDVFGVSTTALMTDLSVKASTGVWTFANLGAIAAGDTLIVSGSTTNDGRYVVLTVGANYLTTATTGLVNETFGAGVSVTYQPADSIAELPQPLSQWNEYLVLHASIAVRAEREQPIGDIGVQFEQIKQRVIDLGKQRSQGVQQAPITRRGYFGAGGWGFGGGGF